MKLWWAIVVLLYGWLVLWLVVDLVDGLGFFLLKHHFHLQPWCWKSFLWLIIFIFVNNGILASLNRDIKLRLGCIIIISLLRDSKLSSQCICNKWHHVKITIGACFEQQIVFKYCQFFFAVEVKCLRGFWTRISRRRKRKSTDSSNR